MLNTIEAAALAARAYCQRVWPAPSGQNATARMNRAAARQSKEADYRRLAMTIATGVSVTYGSTLLRTYGPSTAKAVKGSDKTLGSAA